MHPLRSVEQSGKDVLSEIVNIPSHVRQHDHTRTLAALPVDEMGIEQLAQEIVSLLKALAHDRHAGATISENFERIVSGLEPLRHERWSRRC